jgi:hypothetical protein
MTTKKVVKKAKTEALAKKEENANISPSKARVRKRVQFIEVDDPEAALAKAVFIARPSVNAAYLIESFSGSYLGGVDKGAMAALMTEHMKEVNDGDLRQCEAMLYGQAQALQSIFTTMAMRASTQEHLQPIEALLKIAFRAQSQCAKTLEVLASMKSPSVIFAKQANISHGHQQVNNTAASAHVKEISNQSNELLEDQHGERMDTRAQGATSGADQTMATVEMQHRSKN